MKSYHDQYRECRSDGFTGVSKRMKYADHPEMLPAPWHPASKKFKEALEKNPELEFTHTLCLKFGGQCSSSNRFCRQIRGCNK